MIKFFVKSGLSLVGAGALCMTFGQYDARAWLGMAFAIFVMLSVAFRRRPKRV